MPASDAAAPEPAPLFIETSIFIWRMNRPRSVRRRIRQQLSQWHPVTSTYVKAEYVHTVLRAAVRLYTLLIERGDIHEAAARWRTEARGGQADLGHWLIEAFLAPAETPAEARRALAQLIEIEIPAWFDDVGCELTDATHCQESGAAVRWREDRYLFDGDFPPAEAPPGLKLFLANQQSLLELLNTAFSRRSEKRWREISACLLAILQGRHRLGVRRWQRMGDVIISLEAAHDGCSVYTTNRLHYQPICAVLAVPILVETAEDLPASKHAVR